jgi:hypothetical protein
MQEEIVGRRPLEVAQDALHGCQMGLPWIVHMQTDLLNDISDVGPCEGQVLESPCNAPKLGSIQKRRPGVGSALRLKVNRSRAWLTISHGLTLDDVQRVCALVEEHPAWTTLHSNAKEVVKWPKILHREFLLWSRNSATQKRRARGCQDDIINVQQQVYRVSAPSKDEQ